MADEKNTLTVRPEPEINRDSDWLFTGAEIRALHQTGSSVAREFFVRDASGVASAREPMPDHIEALFESESPYVEREADAMRIERVTRALSPIETEEPSERSVEIEKQIIFSLASTRYAVPMANILEIAELNYLTPAPNLPEWIVGVTNLRGDILSVLDFRVFLDLPQEESTDSQRMLVSQTTDGAITTGIIVDSVLGMEAIDITQVQEMKTEAENRLAPFLKGEREHDDGFVRLIDLEAWLRSLENIS